MVVPATINEEIEAVDGDEVAQRVLVVHSAQWSHLHRRTHRESEELGFRRSVGGGASKRLDGGGRGVTVVPE